MIHITQEQMDRLIDEVFGFVVSKIPASNLLVKFGLEAAHGAIKLGADALFAHLTAKGIIGKAAA